MSYIDKATRLLIVEHLAARHDAFVWRRDEQPPHPKGGVQIVRCLAGLRIKELRDLIEKIMPGYIAKMEAEAIAKKKNEPHLPQEK